MIVAMIELCSIEALIQYSRDKFGFIQLTCTGIQLSRKLSRKKNNSALQVLRKHNQN